MIESEDNPDQPKAGLWTEDLSDNDRKEVLEWSVKKFDVIREYWDEDLLLSDAETGEFVYLITKSEASLPRRLKEKLKSIGITVVAFETNK